MTQPNSDTRPDEGGWLPIETAPKDGSGVMLIDMNAHQPEAGKGWFVFGVWSGVEPLGQLGLGREVFHAVAWNSPTHWRPLPLPPGYNVARGRVPDAMKQIDAFIHFRRNGVPRVPSINQLTEWRDLLDEMREALAAFVNIRDQFPQSIKLIDPKLDGMAPMTITITKGQFVAAEQLVSNPPTKDHPHEP